METWHTRIKQARLAKKISQENLANLLKISRTAIAQWETKSTQMLGAELLLRTCFILDAEPYYIMFGEVEQIF